MRYITISLACLLSGCVSDNWTRKDTALELVYLTALAADAYTTTQIQYHPGLYENNPIVRSALGAQPETDDTWQLAMTVGLSHYLIARILPAKWRTYWQVGSALSVSASVIGNCDAGLCSSRPTKPCLHATWRSDDGVWRCQD